MWRGSSHLYLLTVPDFEFVQDGFRDGEATEGAEAGSAEEGGKATVRQGSGIRTKEWSPQQAPSRDLFR